MKLHLKRLKLSSNSRINLSGSVCFHLFWLEVISFYQTLDVRIVSSRVQ